VARVAPARPAEGGEAALALARALPAWQLLDLGRLKLAPPAVQMSAQDAISESRRQRFSGWHAGCIGLQREKREGRFLTACRTNRGKPDLAPIRVNAVALGLIDRPLWDSFGAQRDAILASTAKLPVRRAGRPEEVAAAAG
jgi:hypothetical protein